MYAVKRIINTYDGYDEHWSDDGRLTVSYYGEHPHELYFDGDWVTVSHTDDNTARYLNSAAVFYSALEKCSDAGFSAGDVFEFLPEERDELLPAELLRMLLDDCGFAIDDACAVIIRSFGKSLENLCRHPWLYSVQPRTAHLETVLSDTLCAHGFALHDPFDSLFRSPKGAVKDGETLTLRIKCFGGVKSASAEIYGDDLFTEIPMRRDGNDFICEFTPESPAALRYRFRLDGGYLCADEAGVFSRHCRTAEEGFRLTVYKRDFVTPDWFAESVMYQVFPDRFGFSDDGTAMSGIEYHRALGQSPQLHGDINEPVKWQPLPGQREYTPDDFYGGTLRGIAKKLPYLRELGITALYLNPIVEAHSNHRYDTACYERPDPILGTVEDYVSLCSEAAGLGIRIINDGVFSHTGADSIYFDRSGCYGGDGAYQNVGSKYYKWYDFRKYPDEYRSWWGFKDLPEVNELCPEWQDYIISGRDSIVRRWLRYGACGWRLDVADELPDEVLGLIRCAAKEEKPDCVIIGEVWEDAVLKESYGKRRSYALGYALDSVMNYPLRTAVISFASGKSSAFELRDFLRSQQAHYPPMLYRSLMNLLGSHDVERLHTALEFDFDIKSLDRASQYELSATKAQYEKATELQKLCAVIQYCIPGVPCLYYGDEECLDGGGDPFCRAPFEPSGMGLHNFYARLGALRNTEKALKSGEMTVQALSPDVLVIDRIADSTKLSAVINRAEAELALPADKAVPLLDTCTGSVIPPLTAQIYKLT